MQPGMNFYGQMPDMFALVVNTEQPAVRRIIKQAGEEIGGELTPLRQKIDELDSEIKTLRDIKPEDNETAEAKADREKSVADKERELGEVRGKEETIITDYAAKVPEVGQIIDLALLKADMLKGHALDEFIRRSVSLL